ncbi:helix-turn-helix domain-containing protein [Streptococcus iniae]
MQEADACQVKRSFSTQQLRELNLIKLLSQDKEAFDYKTICRQLDCSFITLQSELVPLKHLSRNFFLSLYRVSFDH